MRAFQHTGMTSLTEKALKPRRQTEGTSSHWSSGPDRRNAVLGIYGPWGPTYTKNHSILLHQAKPQFIQFYPPTKYGPNLITILTQVNAGVCRTTQFMILFIRLE